MQNNLPKIAVIDGSYLVFRTIFSSSENEIQSENYIKYLVLRSIIKEISLLQAFPIVAFDWRGSAYRSSIYPEYKQDRKSQEDELDVIIPIGEHAGKSINDPSVTADALISLRTQAGAFLSQSEIDAINNKIQMKLFLSARDFVCNELGSIGILGVKIRGYEADDFGFLFSHCTSHEGYLVSDDSDWKLFLTDHWQIRRPLKESFITLDEFSSEFQSTIESTGKSAPEIYKHILALTGTHNNVIGYHGIGEKTGLKIAELLLSGQELDNTKAKHKIVLEDECAKYQLNLKVISSDHISEQRDVLFEALLSAANNVKKVSQIEFIKIASSIQSERLPEYFQKYSSSVKHLTPDELKSGFIALTK